MTIRYIDVRAIAWDTPVYSEAVAWLESNGISPNDVLLDSRIAVSDSHITYEGFVKKDGIKQLDKSGERALLKTYKVPKKADPDASLLAARRSLREGL